VTLALAVFALLLLELAITLTSCPGGGDRGAV
jgi:hypothetical protein